MSTGEHEDRGVRRPHAQRRFRPHPTAAELLHDAVFGSLDWPTKTVRLESDTATELRQRLTTSRIGLAELYHENSKLTDQSIRRLAVPLSAAEEFREAASQVRVADPDVRLDVLKLPPAYGEIVSRAAARLPIAAFYAIELRVLFQDRLAGWDPVSRELVVLRRLRPAELSALVQGVHLRETVPLDDRSLLICLAGWFAREELLLGTRGYRRVLLQGGRAVEALLAIAAELDVIANPVYEFVDHDVDSALGLDGIEQAIVALIALRRE
jgi:hypothetical protein